MEVKKQRNKSNKTDDELVRKKRRLKITLSDSLEGSVGTESADDDDETIEISVDNNNNEDDDDVDAVVNNKTSDALHCKCDNVVAKRNEDFYECGATSNKPRCDFFQWVDGTQATTTSSSSAAAGENEQDELRSTNSRSLLMPNPLHDRPVVARAPSIVSAAVTREGGLQAAALDVSGQHTVQQRPPMPSSSRSSSSSSATTTTTTTKQQLALALQQAPANLNEHITRLLEMQQRMYKVDGERHRETSVRKAVSLIKSLPFRVTNANQLHGHDGVGASTIRKVQEILETGSLQKLKLRADEFKVLDLFAKVWGAGPQTGKKWYAKGYRTLEDIRAAGRRGELTQQQTLGLKYYDDLQLRIPRAEVMAIEDMVYRELTQIIPGMQMATCGSFRRGKPTCGDVDIVITHDDGHSHTLILGPLVQRLKACGFIVDDLAEGDCKYEGVARLPGYPHFRRIDFFTVPRSELATSLLMWTGSTFFNRAIRHVADQLGLYLNQHGLFHCVRDSRGEKAGVGPPLPTMTEQDIFDHLGLEYLPPHQREPAT